MTNKFMLRVADDYVITLEEYEALLAREAKEFWGKLDEEEKEAYNNDFNKYAEEISMSDWEFVPCDKDGNKLSWEDAL
ncbi:hypothetical protein HB904_04480 [Listeria booriae]|uniref:Uncharacterized protein n=1 Tax=Listeria booriae TaxID=1552123 RepID=A0A842AGP2_9LIST|nr:hypothetical protein [Listeria booriae]MBC1615430.1 hypothetical protein [Listeria booriae]